MAGPGKPKTGGRKKGSMNRTTVALRNEIVRSGLTPMEIFAERMAGKNLPKGLTALEKAEMIYQAAKDLAPYVHPRLQATAFVPVQPSNDQEQTLSMVELVRRIGFALEIGIKSTKPIDVTPRKPDA